MSTKKKLVKLLVIFYSLVNVLMGFALVLLSVAIVSTGYTYLEPREKTTLLYLLSFGTTVCGLFTTIAGILGFLGAVCRSPCLLALTATILLVPLAASIYISNKETSAVRASVRDKLEEVLFEAYGRRDHLTMVVDFVQSTLKCCGVEGPADWADSIYNTGNVSRTGEPIQDKDYLIPASCCRFKKRCTFARNITLAKNHTPRKGIYSRGCGILIDGHIRSLLEQAEVILLSDAALDIVGIIFIWILFLIFRHDIAKEEADGPRTNV
ncbi:leukocyte surface antigen CD53-like [Galendromus occidentalis]|uniref:Tetraspanin n=1 Tax=Galendromus occidentalis TaxID=34638 RepID=A0AAJ6QTX0_9ACAR|nr:leukocyte surface antigen CD53-like [Galendromus occidentalis]